MLETFMRGFNKTVDVELFSFEPQSLTGAAQSLTGSEMQLNSAHIFWQAGSGGGNTAFLVRAIQSNPQAWRIVRTRVASNSLIYVGVCVGACMAGSNDRYIGAQSLAGTEIMYKFFGPEVDVVYDNSLPC